MVATRSKILALALEYANGKTNPKEVAEKVIKSVQSINKKFGNVILDTDSKLNIDDNPVSSSKSILSGIPIAIKDNFNCQNMKATAGSRKFYIEFIT